MGRKMHVGKFIRLIRDISGLNASQLAERAGISRIGLANIESGKHSPKLSTIQAIAGGLGLTTKMLFELSDEYEIFEKGVLYAVGVKEGGEDGQVDAQKQHCLR